MFSNSFNNNSFYLVGEISQLDFLNNKHSKIGLKVIKDSEKDTFNYFTIYFFNNLISFKIGQTIQIHGYLAKNLYQKKWYLNLVATSIS